MYLTAVFLYLSWLITLLSGKEM